MAKTGKKKAGKKAAAKTEFEPRSAAAKAKLEGDEKDYSSYAEKEPTDLQERMGVWILDKTGIEVEDEASFLEGVRLAVALRMEFQASPENQEVLAERRRQREEAEEEREAAPKPKRGRPAKKSAKAVEEDEEEADEEEAEAEEEEAPKPKARRAATKTKTAEAKPKARRTAAKRKAAPVDDDEDAAPY